MASIIKPEFVQFHDGSGKSFVMMVTHRHPDDHVSGAVWCQDADNNAGLSDGWNVRNKIGRGDESKAASWSPFPEDITEPGKP